MGQRKTHPAVTALKAAHAEFKAYLAPRGGTHVCYDSDLRHDERIITTKWRDEPLVWIVTYASTHLIRFPSDVECYTATRSDWMRLAGHGGAMRVIDYVLDTYRPRTVIDGGIRAFIWDGVALHRMTTIDALWSRVCEIVRNRAVGHIEKLYPEVREDLAYARERENPQAVARCEERIAGLDRDLEIAKEWGHE
jgi:hypothetical protein